MFTGSPGWASLTSDQAFRIEATRRSGVAYTRKLTLSILGIS
jgi:hypothetical protein